MGLEKLNNNKATINFNKNHLGYLKWVNLHFSAGFKIIEFI